MNLGKRFRHFREKAGFTQKDAAEFIGVNYYQLGNYETNRSEPNIDTLKKMSLLYKVSIDTLVANTPIEGNKEALVCDADFEKLIADLKTAVDNLDSAVTEAFPKN